MPTHHKLTPFAKALRIRHAFRTRALLPSMGLGLGLVLPCIQVQAQEVNFNVPAQPLAKAIQELGRQADLQVLFNASEVQTLKSNAVSGELTLEQAAKQMLAGTGIRFHLENGTLTLTATGNNQGSDLSVLEMDATQVVTNSLGTVTEGSGLYTPGKNSTATRLVLTPRETPQSISVITRQQIDDFSLNSIDNVMRHVPGVNVVTYDSDRTDYRVRGFSVNNFQYDGIPTTRVSTYSAGQTQSDMAIYDRVEVLKGATGLLTGTGTPGASINLIRKKPTSTFQGHITGSAGSWDNYRSELDVGGPLNDAGTVRGRFVASHQDKHSYLDHYKKKTDVYYGTMEFDLTPDTLLTFGADSQDSDPKGSTWGGNIIFDKNGDFNKRGRSENNGARWSSWEQYTRTVFATLEHSFANGWVGKAQLTHAINGYDAPLSSVASGNPDPADGTGASLWSAKYVGKTKNDSADLYLTGPFQLFGREHELVLGSSFSKKRWESKSYRPPADYDRSVSDYYEWDGDIPEPDWEFSQRFKEDTRQRGFYATTRLSLTDDTKLILGGRTSDYRGETVTKKGVFTPYAGIVHDLNDNYSIYASYTSIFSPQTLKTEEGKDLDPLEGDSYEVGLKGEFYEGLLNTSLAYFEIHQDNYAVRTGNRAPDGTNAYKAVQGVVSKGYELELSGELAPGWQAQAGFTHKVARRDGNKESTIEPENLFSLYTSYKLPDDSLPLTVGAGARWQSKSWADLTTPKDETKTFTQKSYWVFDLMSRYQINHNLSASLNVNNLFDKKYYTIMDIYSVYSWGEPRNVTASLRWDL